MIVFDATAVCGDGSCKKRCAVKLRLVQKYDKRNGYSVVYKAYEPPAGWLVKYYPTKSKELLLSARCPLHSGDKKLVKNKTGKNRFAKLIFDD